MHILLIKVLISFEFNKKVEYIVCLNSNVQNMCKLYFVIAFLLCFGLSQAQETVTIKLAGVTPEVAQKLKSSGDRLSWFTSRGSDKLASNIFLELSNVGEKKTDRGRAAVKADPDASGMYTFDAAVDVELKKINKSKPLHIEVMMQTIFGNEVFYLKDLDFAALSEPIVLNGYMWRATNEKISPEKDLCIEFSSFIDDATLRKKVSENEGAYKFDRSDFSVYLKQNKEGEWIQLKDKLEGGISNGNSINLTNPMPSWIDPSKELFVRFAAVSPLKNYVWGEYSVKPHEYRKEYRATHYTSIAFDPESKPNMAAESNQAELVSETQIQKEEIPAKEEVKEQAQVPEKPSEKVNSNEKAVQKSSQTNKETQQVKSAQPVKNKSGGAVQNIYQETVANADSLFAAFKYAEAKLKYEEASKLMPLENYPKDQAAICVQKLSAIKAKKSPMKGSAK